MKKISGRIIALLLTVIMASGTVVSADVNSDIKSAKQEALAARDVLAKYESELTLLNARKKDAEKKCKQAKAKADAAWKPYKDAVNSMKIKSKEFRKIKSSYDFNTQQIGPLKENIRLGPYNIRSHKESIETIKNSIADRVEARRKEIINDYNDAIFMLEQDKKDLDTKKKSYDAMKLKIENYKEKEKTIKDELKVAQKEYDEHAAQYNEGMFGFLKWQQTAYPKYADDARKALDILTNCRDAKYNKKGDPDNAVYLANVLYMEDFLNEYNRLRQNDPNFDKRGEVLKVNSVAMVMAQANANYAGQSPRTSSNVDAWDFVVSSQFPVTQLIALGGDPYEGWYWEEKELYEKRDEDNWEFWTGHYRALMEIPNPNTAIGLAMEKSKWVQVIVPSSGEYANGPLIPISEYFSMLKEYNNIVYPEKQAEKVEKIKTDLWNLHITINNCKDALENFQNDIDRYTEMVNKELKETKKKKGYIDYQNMDKELAKVRSECEAEIKEIEKQIKQIKADLEKEKKELERLEPNYNKAVKTYENKLKDFPEIEKLYYKDKAAGNNYDKCVEKLDKYEDEIANLKDKITIAKADYDKKLANYKKILKKNGLKYEDNKLEDPTTEPDTKNPVKTITLKAKTSTTAMAGKQVKIEASVKPADASKKLTWTSSNKSYATVNSAGVVTTKPAGAGKTVVIRATATDGSKKTNTIKLKIVKDGVTSIALKGNTSVKAGGSTKITATVKASGKTANKELGWKSSNKDFASVSPNGVVHANEAGKGKTVTITAYSLDGTGIKKSIKISIN